MASYFDDKEWQWLFDNAVLWDKILPLYYPEFPTEQGFQSKEEIIAFLKDVLGTTGSWAAESIAGRARRLDEVGPGEVRDGEAHYSEPLKELFREAKELGFFSLSAETEYGGSGAPILLSFIAFSQVARACQSSSSQLTFFGAIADMIERFADQDLKDKYIQKLCAGEISGGMCLTEPGAGSDLGSLRTKAVKINEKEYEITGNKIFITNAGGEVTLVLARVEGAPEGLAGISLFLVPKRKEGSQELNFRVVKNEKKMGQHGAFTSELVYEKSWGRIVGQENEGFKIMLHLMNEARTGVGGQALGGMEACLSYVKQYATERKQFGRSLMELPLYRKNFEELETEMDAFRAMLVDTLSHYDAYQFLDKKKRLTGDLTSDEEELLKDSLSWVRRRTPLVKFYGTETYSMIAKKSVQALGGYGYMKEYDVERYLRDSFGGLLYEGTSQIQSLMALKDLMKFVMKNPKRFFQTMVYSHPVGQLFESSSPKKSFGHIQYDFKKNFSSLLLKVVKPKETDIKKLMKPTTWAGEQEMEKLMEYAEDVCSALSYIETLRVLCNHSCKDNSRTELFERYLKLVQPRLAQIYCRWRIN